MAGNSWRRFVGGAGRMAWKVLFAAVKTVVVAWLFHSFVDSCAGRITKDQSKSGVRAPDKLVCFGTDTVRCNGPRDRHDSRYPAITIISQARSANGPRVCHFLCGLRVSMAVPRGGVESKFSGIDKDAI